MTKVYVVTSGNYSDYQIRAIFSSSALAEAWIKELHGYTDVNEKVGEFILDSEPIPNLACQIIMDRKGTVEDARLEEISEYNQLGFSYFTFSFSNPNEKSLVWIVDTFDEERAIKVVNEKRTQILALGIWGDDDAVKERVQ